MTGPVCNSGVFAEPTESRLPLPLCNPSHIVSAIHANVDSVETSGMQTLIDGKVQSTGLPADAIVGFLADIPIAEIQPEEMQTLISTQTRDDFGLAHKILLARYLETWQRRNPISQSPSAIDAMDINTAMRALFDELAKSCLDPGSTQTWDHLKTLGLQS